VLSPRSIRSADRVRPLSSSTSRAVTAVVAAVLLVLLAGCGGAAPAASSSPSAGGLTIRDSYVKAAPKSGSMPMSAIFGVLTNPTGRDITVVSGASDAASTVELHEMVMAGGKMKMQPRDGGFVVPANGELALEPGGLHLMLIGLTRDIRAGETVSATLTTADGRTVAVQAVGRDLPNANESYAPEGDMDLGQDG
jgi:copper(I)-binding protein